MVLVLVIGDLFVPIKKPGLPNAFKQLLVPGKISHVLCTGNLCGKKTEDYFRELADQVHIVQGDMDEYLYPERLVISIESLKFGLCHGHQVLPVGNRAALNALRRDMGVDVLLTGSSMKIGYVQDDLGGLIMYPGSATGAPEVDDTAEPDPSFLLIDVQGRKIVAFLYLLVDGDLKVEKAVFECQTS